MSDIHQTLAALRLGGPVMYPLALLALLAAVLIVDKAYIFWKFARLPNTIRDSIEQFDMAWSAVEAELQKLGTRHYYARFLQVIASHRSNPVWWIESRSADEAQMIEQSLGRGLWVLETIVTAAPLLGLLGTIAGMMSAFKLIGSGNLVDPAGVTGGVAEALIATAFGLLIAVVALFAYNYFSRLQSQTLDEMERLGTRLVDHIRIDQDASLTAGAAREAA